MQTSIKNLASAVGQKTQQRPTGIAWFFYNKKGKTNQGQNIFLSGFLAGKAFLLLS
jgi:hypothetical protein